MSGKGVGGWWMLLSGLVDSELAIHTLTNSEASSIQLTALVRFKVSAFLTPCIFPEVPVITL